MAVVDDCGLRWPVTLVGHSMGAHTALVVAGTYPPMVQRLVLVDGDVGGGGAAALDGLERALLAWPRSFATRDEVRSFFGGETLAGDTWADSYVARDGRWHLRFDPATTRRVMAPLVLDERWDLWQAVTARVDLVLAERSLLDPARIARMCAIRPATRRHVILDAGHDLHLHQPDRWIELARGLLGPGGRDKEAVPSSTGATGGRRDGGLPAQSKNSGG